MVSVTGALFASIALIIQLVPWCPVHCACGVCYRGTVRQHRPDGDSQYPGVQYDVQRCLCGHGGSCAWRRFLCNGGHHLSGLAACSVSSVFGSLPKWGIAEGEIKVLSLN